VDTDTEVVVVGAGLAGLTAALHLTAAGVEVTLLEAGDDVGGRVRTDLVDGYRLDRGFQVFNTAYPELARVLDVEALDLRPFTPGALLYRAGRFHRVADPRRRPRLALATAHAPIGPARDKLRLATLTARCVLTPPQRLLDRPDRTTAEALAAAGLSEEIVERFLRPLLSGVFLDSELTTSSRFFELIWRCFALGTQGVPAAGMAAIPRQLADRLPPGVLRLHSPVSAVDPHGVRTEDGPVTARAVVVAADPPAAGRLLPAAGPTPRMHPSSTLYHSAEADPVGEPTLCLDADRRGLISSSVVLTAAAPGYAPPGRALISTLVVGPVEPAEPAVRAQLREWFGPRVDGWDHLASYRIPVGTPAQPPPMHRLRRPVRVGAGRYVAGDWRDSASTQGAAVSGRRAARAVLADLRSR
jgi:phytoene dehydrogenase-like protein